MFLKDDSTNAADLGYDLCMVHKTGDDVYSGSKQLEIIGELNCLNMYDFFFFHVTHDIF